MEKSEWRLPVRWNGSDTSLPENTKIKIKNYLPMIDPDDIERDVFFYVVQRDGAADNRTPSDVISTISDTRATLVAALTQILSPEFLQLERVFVAAAKDTDGMKHLSNLQTDLMEAIQLLDNAKQHIPAGRQVSPRERLVRLMAQRLIDAGITPTPKGGGDLFRLVTLVLEGLGESTVEHPVEVRKLLQNAFGLRKAKSASVAPSRSADK
ncbi:hypothetical protein RUR49_19285 [Pseudoxanthobacter sp. M-2]|uniref:hypothetical protein n=1 Tax=Pseudoxanthobacter sp. M-2 TaxID=3078754 RepID=UPI0038FCF491